MLHSYNSYRIILESKTREKKIEKVISKIKNFANIPDIYNWAIDKCTNDRRSTEGLQYAVWFANQLKKEIISRLKEYFDADEEKIKKIFNGEIKKIKEDFISFEELCLNTIKDNTFNERINYIIDWLKSPIRTEKVNLSELDLDSAYKKSEEWHNSLIATGKILDETGKIFIEFDDGFYWINLQTTYSKSEAEAMGHCGNTNDGDTLFSLRDKNKSPHVTVAYDTKEGIIYQMKGRNNHKPIDKYHPYIYRLLVDPTLKPKYFGYEWNKEEDFNLSDFDKETFDKVFRYNPNLIYESIEYDHKMCKGLIKKGYLDKDEIKEILLKSKRQDIIMDFCGTDIYTNEEMKEFIKMLNITPKNSTDLVVLKLYDNKYFSKEQLVEKFSDLELIDGKLYIVADKDDMSNFASDSVINILMGDDPFGDWDFPWYDMDSSDQVWDDLTKENKEKVIDKIIEYSELLDYKYYRTDKQYWFYDVKPTKDMFKWIEKSGKKGGEYYFVYNDYNYEVDILIDQNKKELDDLYTVLNRALLSAQRMSDENEYYKRCRKSVKDAVGEFTRDSFKQKYGDKIRHIEVLRFNADDMCDWTDMVTFLEDEYTYRGTIDWDAENYGNIWSILKSMDKFDKADINDDYGIYGTIDPEVLNDYLSNDLANM